MALKKSKNAAVEPEVEEGPVRHEWPSPVKPSALLVPRYIIENNAADKTRRVAVLVVGAIALAAAVGVAFVFMAAISTKTELTAAEGQRDSAQVNVDRLQPISDYYDGLEQRSQATLGLLTNDIAHAKLLRTFQGAMPSGVTFSSYAPAVGTPCPGPDPFSVPDSLGCITVEVQAPSEAQVATLLSNIEASEGGLLSDPFVSGLTSAETESGSGVTFSLSVNFSSAAYSNKYVEAPPVTDPATDPNAVPGADTGTTTDPATTGEVPTDTTGGTQ